MRRDSRAQVRQHGKDLLKMDAQSSQRQQTTQVMNRFNMLTEGSNVSAPGFSEGPSFGAYLDLIAGIAIAVGGVLQDQERSPHGA